MVPHKGLPFWPTSWWFSMQHPVFALSWCWWSLVNALGSSSPKMLTTEPSSNMDVEVQKRLQIQWLHKIPKFCWAESVAQEFLTAKKIANFGVAKKLCTGWPWPSQIAQVFFQLISSQMGSFSGKSHFLWILAERFVQGGFFWCLKNWPKFFRGLGNLIPGPNKWVCLKMVVYP